MVDLERLLPALSGAGVEFIVIGGVAAIVHGSARLTQDLDVVYRRNPENIVRLATALKPFAPYLRGAPPGLPFQWDAETIQRGLNFTLVTSVGPLDVLGEIAGGGTYETLISHSRKLSVFGIECYCLGLDRLIQAKRDAGRPKDLEVIAELEALRDESPPQ
jgi:predicted nucleotidyltransferase